MRAAAPGVAVSYNVTDVTPLVLDARMTAEDIATFYDELEDDLPEGNFLESIIDEARAAIAAGEPDREIALKNFWWYGDWSGRSLDDVLISTIAPEIRGKVEAIVTWEGGDSVDGILIEDGRAARCKIERRVVRPEGWPA